MLSKLLFLSVILATVLGCGIGDRVQKAITDAEANSNSNTTTTTATNSNKTLTDTVVDTAVGEQKIGIVECDEAVEILSAQANNPDDNFVTKAVKKTALNTFRDQLKKSLEENKTDKNEVAKFCREFRDNLQDSTSDGNTNTSGNSWK